jgi:hypothetical protein
MRLRSRSKRFVRACCIARTWFRLRGSRCPVIVATRRSGTARGGFPYIYRFRAPDWYLLLRCAHGQGECFTKPFTIIYVR